MEPSTVSTVPNLQIQDVDFISPERKMKTLKMSSDTTIAQLLMAPLQHPHHV